jgi:hypothetical protein
VAAPNIREEQNKELVMWTYPEETNVIGPVPRIGVEHVGSEDTRDDTDNIAKDEVRDGQIM